MSEDQKGLYPLMAPHARINGMIIDRNTGDLLHYSADLKVRLDSESEKGMDSYPEVEKHVCMMMQVAMDQVALLMGTF